MHIICGKASSMRIRTCIVVRFRQTMVGDPEKDVDKVPNEKPEYGNGTLRGAHWADQVLQNVTRLEKDREKTSQEELLNDGITIH